MTDLEIKKKFDPLLSKLLKERNLDIAENVVSSILELLNLTPSDRELANIPRVDAELSRFELAPGFARQAAAFNIPVNKSDIFDPKLFWVKKTNKTNLSWLVGLAPNFEDSEANDYKSIGIDFVIPATCDSVIILLSNKYKIRSLELKGSLSHTQVEIFSLWRQINFEAIGELSEIKKNIHSKLWESFNFEPINRRFYLELVELFSLLVNHLEKNYGRKPSVMFTTRLIGRILFIWFLTKKSLINQKINYFEVDDPSNQFEYYRNKLEVLFFDVLNKEFSDRKNGDKETPYLNGGLFDISTTDFYGDDALTFPNGFFNQLFLVLSKYNFTVDESSPEFQQVAIDPEMLGRIFESLLAEQVEELGGNNKKKATGAFYTPREIVSYMCEETILEYLKSKIPVSIDRDRRLEELIRLPETIFRDQDQNKRRDWKPYSEIIINSLIGVDGSEYLTVLDPAVGSGAFPMGMLQLLVKIFGRLDPKYEKNISSLKRDILSKSIYGVDIEQTAIEICRLRAWLSIIVDIPEGSDIEPLPNLDFKFACSNTLVFLDDEKQASFFSGDDLKEKLMVIRNDYFNTSNKTKKKRLQDAYEKLTHEEDLFDSKKALQLKSYKPFNLSSSSDFYDPELIHGVKKFDIVIGNPPYVDSEWMTKTNPKLRKYCSEYYQSAKGNWDLFCVFVEKGMLLCKPNGISSMIIPNKLISSKYADSIRKLIASKATLKSIRDYSSVKVFEVSVYPIVYLVKNRLSKKEDHFLYEKMSEGMDTPLLSNEFSLSDAHLDKYDDWSALFSSSEGGLVDKISKNNIELGSLASVKGAATVSEAYLIQPLLSDLDKSDKQYIKFANTGSIDPYISFWGKSPTRYLKNSYLSPIIKRDQIPNLPPKRVLEANSQKIIIGGMTKNLECYFDDGSFLAGKSTTIVVNPQYPFPYILGILNSKLMTYFYNERFSGLSLQGGFFRVGPPQIQQLPIANPDNDSVLATKLIELVEKLLDAVSRDSSVVKQLKVEIDLVVYALYKLTPEEIKLVETSTGWM